MTDSDDRDTAWWSKPEDDPWRPPQSPARGIGLVPAGRALPQVPVGEQAEHAEPVRPDAGFPGHRQDGTARPKSFWQRVGQQVGQRAGRIGQVGQRAGRIGQVGQQTEQRAGWAGQQTGAVPHPSGWSFSQGERSERWDTLGELLTTSRVRMPLGVLIGGALAIALLAGLTGGGIGAFLQGRDQATVNDPNASLGSAPVSSVDRPPDSVAGIAARVLPSVVSIQVQGGGKKGTGSGSVIRTDGYILTNNHVVDLGATGGGIEVQFSGGQKVPAKVVGRDASYDLAVIKVDKVSGLKALSMGNSDTVQIGDPVIAIGSPLGLSGTVTTGIISAKDRAVTAGGNEGGGEASFIDALQTDAAINPGNSGGPLVNLQGQVVGVNSAIATVGAGNPLGGAQGGNIGLGFSIPINQARRTAEQLIRSGKAVHPIIGVTLDRQFQGDGVRILPQPQGPSGPPVQTGGPAEKAGLRPGDVIIKLDGKAVSSADELIVAIRSKVPGNKVQVTFLRGGKEQTVPVVLAPSPEQ